MAMIHGAWTLKTGHQSGESTHFKKVVLMLDIGNVKQYYPLLDN